MKELYEQYKGLLFKLAYQLTGSASDAEDAVQDVFLKIYGVPPERLAEPKAYLCKMVTNRCLDILKSARRKREQYFGHWLPEPVLTPNELPHESAVRGELLSYAVLVLLEELSPAERAAFVLREAFGFEYSEIAGMIGKSEANCRKLFSRARDKTGTARKEPVFAGTAGTAGKEWAHRFLAALEQGDVEAVVSLLAADVTVVSDGGSKAAAAVQPIVSCERVVPFLFGLFRKVLAAEGGVRIEMADINGQWGVIVRSGNEIDTVILMHVENGLLHQLYFVRNPDKLRLPCLW